MALLLTSKYVSQMRRGTQPSNHHMAPHTVYPKNSETVELTETAVILTSGDGHRRKYKWTSVTQFIEVKRKSKQRTLSRCKNADTKKADQCTFSEIIE